MSSARYSTGGSASANDVDGGPTYLASPTIDLSGTDASISYALWFYSDNGSDVLTVEVSNDNGGTWTHVETVTGTGGTWQTHSFVVGDVLPPTDQVRVRFSTVDAAPASITVTVSSQNGNGSFVLASGTVD